MEAFLQEEQRDGTRWSWNIWPTSRLEATRMVVPLGCLYTPLMKVSTPLLNYEPVGCKSCHGIMNPYCMVDVQGKLWVCGFCYQRNQLPPQYMNINETTLPAELIPNFTTIQYSLPARTAALPPIFLYVVDTCLDEPNLAQLKDSILMSLSMIPENALVGLITYGTTVQVYELGFTECPKSYVFRGNKDVAAKQVQQLLGLNAPPAVAPNAPRPAAPLPQQNRFLRPFKEIELSLESIIDELQRDPRPVKNDKRPLRATGVALAVAVGLLETSYPGTGARILTFVGGPCTQGPGMVVSEELKEALRSQNDIVKDKAPHSTKATKYFESLANRAVNSGHTVDIYACSLDQVGTLEMRYLVKKTGGLLVQADEFDTPMFKQSFQKIFARDEQHEHNMAFNATLEVQTSRELKVCGAIGHCASKNKKTSSVAETEIGIGGTSAWRICGLDSHSTLALYFEVVNQHSNPIPTGQRALVQFLTTYQKPNGQRIVRVTTVSHSWAPGEDPKEALMMGFDQEAAAVLMARIAVYKAETEEAFDVMRWLDRMLIRLANKFATFEKDNPATFSLSSNFSIYPQFMFHLRRSPFLQNFNNSPDEVTFYRYMLNRENVMHSLTMIQPTLDAYTFGGAPVPVLLSATSLLPDRILLLDTFFAVVIFRGENIAQWVKAGYATDPKHENFRLLLQAPRIDADALIKDRFPVPRFIECDQHGSQARYVLAAIDPSVTHMSGGAGGSGVDPVFTEDVSLEVFMDHLKKLAVSSS
eukprot:TRINITY_DN4651_c0_g1_i1.p1 TRINITY_DN4651_c0_g1~~TRINITY_DN4651_c0_g1_i1.p1  ORF type:complete len:758 (+),score=106.88 TRINITY_DN4651_c0_g1_i1:183-2456(+)